MLNGRNFKNKSRSQVWPTYYVMIHGHTLASGGFMPWASFGTGKRWCSCDVRLLYFQEIKNALSKKEEEENSREMDITR